MRFIDRPLDLVALDAVLDAMARAPGTPETQQLVIELQVLVEEARRAFDRAPWEDRIVTRWRALEATIRSGRDGSPAPPDAEPGWRA